MEENIIQVGGQRTEGTDDAFKDFMCLTQNEFNSRAQKNPKDYRKFTGKSLENVAVSILQEVAPQTPFSADDIKLVSGQCFPDIIAGQHYGVEVKTTDKNHWTSTGSSIIESTRVEGIERIYMLFGKLGGNPPEFRCRPYEDVLYDIAVTHSPRYLINMDIKKGETIFDKLKIPYNEIRTDEDSISKVRNYYREEARRTNKKEIPWWLTADDVAPAKMRLWSGYPEENRRLEAKMFVLFPDVLRSQYGDVAMWLCSRYSVVVHNARDSFSAGGKLTEVNGHRLKVRLPHVVGSILEHDKLIVKYLTNKMGNHTYNDEMICYENIYFEILSYRPELLNKGNDLLETWLTKTIASLSELKEVKEYGIKDFNDHFRKWFGQGLRCSYIK